MRRWLASPSSAPRNRLAGARLIGLLVVLGRHLCGEVTAGVESDRDHGDGPQRASPHVGIGQLVEEILVGRVGDKHFAREEAPMHVAHALLPGALSLLLLAVGCNRSQATDEVIEEVTERHRSDVEERLTKAREQRRLDRKNAKKEARRLQRTGDAGMSTGGAAAESGATEGIPEDVSSSPSSSSEADDPDAYATTFAGAMQNVVKLLTTVRSTWEEKVNAVRDVARMVRDLGNMDHTLQDYSVSEFATAEDLHDFEKTYDFLVRKIAVHDADRMTREEFEAATEKAVLWKDVARGTHIPQATWLNPRPFRRSNNNGNNNYRKTAAPAAATSSPPPASRRSSRT